MPTDSLCSYAGSAASLPGGRGTKVNSASPRDLVAGTWLLPRMEPLYEGKLAPAAATVYGKSLGQRQGYRKRSATANRYQRDFDP